MKIVYGVVDGKRKPIALLKRNCDLCGVEYQPLRQTSSFCSAKCMKKNDSIVNADKACERSKRWYRANLEKAKATRKAYYWSDPERFKAKTKKWRLENLEKAKATSNTVKDNLRHGGKRSELIKENGLVCSSCGKSGGSFDIVAHHTTFKKTDHENQELLCRSCHAKIHRVGNDKQ